MIKPLYAENIIVGVEYKNMFKLVINLQNLSL